MEEKDIAVGTFCDVLEAETALMQSSLNFSGLIEEARRVSPKMATKLQEWNARITAFNVSSPATVQETLSESERGMGIDVPENEKELGVEFVPLNEKASGSSSSNTAQNCSTSTEGVRRKRTRGKVSSEKFKQKRKELRKRGGLALKAAQGDEHLCRKMRLSLRWNIVRYLWAQNWARSNPSGTVAEFETYYEKLSYEEKKKKFQDFRDANNAP